MLLQDSKATTLHPSICKTIGDPVLNYPTDDSEFRIVPKLLTSHSIAVLDECGDTENEVVHRENDVPCDAIDSLDAHHCDRLMDSCFYPHQ